MLTLGLSQEEADQDPARVVRHARAARRLRVQVPGLLGDPFVARHLEEELRRWPGVTAVRANVRSGRLLVEYAALAALAERLREVPSPQPPRRERARGVLGRVRGVFDRLHRVGETAAAPGPDAPWHALPAEQVLARLAAAGKGLSAAGARRRLRLFGPNTAEEVAQRSRLSILAAQVSNLPAAILLGSSAVSVLLGDLVDAGAILTVVALNTAIGYTIERRSADLLASWRRLEAGEVEALRDGEVRRVPAGDLVPGDVILCRAGAIVPADARVLEAHNLACEEAPLTGESEPQRKGPGPVAAAAPLSERTSMIYAGTTVASGTCHAVVTGTGGGTELARVRRLLEQEEPPPVPLEERLAHLGSRAAFLGIGSALGAAAAGIVRGRPLGRVLRTAIALGVAALPEGLPVVSTAALVRSMQRMRARGMVVRRLASAETLGGVTVICMDKTGTLTCNEMRLEVLDLGAGPLDPRGLRARPAEPLAHPPTLALAAALLNSEVEVERGRGGVTLTGSSTERALVTAAQAAGLDPERLRQAFPRRLLRLRAEGVHYMISLHEAPGNGGAVAFVKGAPEQVLGLCAATLDGPLDAEERRRRLARNEELASQGLRVLALAWRRLPPAAAPAGEDVPEDGYTFIGLAGLRDPLRPGAAGAVQAARSAGIRTLILTGDQHRTAEAVARGVGLRGAARDGGAAQKLLADGDPDGLLDRLAVLWRVTPADKLAVVRELRRRGAIVAMAGDGINDAPALKAAHVGIAVGRGSSDLARQVADVVLAGEDLHSILVAVAEGRIVQDNLRRALRFLFATNFSETALVLGAALVGAPEPLTPLQLLWINLLTDTLPALALALEPGDPEVLDRAPAPPGAPLLAPAEWRRLGRDGALLSALGAAGFVLGGTPLCFSTLCGAQLSYTAVCQAAGSVPDRQFLGLAGVSVALQAAALFVPGLRRVLSLRGTSPHVPAGFAAGLLLPWLASQLAGGETIVRSGPAAAPEKGRDHEVQRDVVPDRGGRRRRAAEQAGAARAPRNRHRGLPRGRHPDRPRGDEAGGPGRPAR